MAKNYDPSTGTHVAPKTHEDLAAIRERNAQAQHDAMFGLVITEEDAKYLHLAGFRGPFFPDCTAMNREQIDSIVADGKRKEREGAANARVQAKESLRLNLENQADVKALLKESAARVAELEKTDNFEGLYQARRTFADHEVCLGRLKRDEKSHRANARGETAEVMV